MRTEISFRLVGSELPPSTNQLSLSLMKWALSEYSGGEYYEKVFGSPGSKNYEERRKFTSALVLPKGKYENDRIVFLHEADRTTSSGSVNLKSSENENEESVQYNGVRLMISTGDTELYLLFLSAFSSLIGKSYSTSLGTKLCLDKINVLPSKQCGRQERFHLLSPLCIRERNDGNRDYYHSCMSERWREVLVKNLKYSLSNMFSPQIIDGLHIELYGARKIVVRGKQTKNGGRVFIEATLGEVQMEGDRALIQYLYDNGLGSRTSTFGMLR